ncbi:MAG: heat-inducible transcriptional repressor HrcA [Endomicrobiales bacterium]|jgi:heat-inducible transcriptional repressor
MRQVNPGVVKERKKKILQAVIHQFIKTGRPVGSNLLTEDYRFDLSPATIRNLMAELEDEGFLTHPHTSSGRTPTDKGYRNYVDSLREIQRLVLDEEDRIRNEYDVRIRELQDMLVHTSRMLSGLSQYTGFVVTPNIDKNLLQYLELVKIAENRILVVLVTTNGLVKHKIIESPVSAEKLEVLTRILNTKLRGLSLLQAKRKIIDELDNMERQEKDLLALAKDLGRDLFSIEEDIYIDGATNVMALPDFHDYEPMRCLLRFNENKGLLRQVLHDDTSTGEIKVVIGSEAACEEFKDLSLVTTVYKEGETPIGVLGIIGPKRMEYPKMMALVRAVSHIVNTMLAKKEEDEGGMRGH